MTFEEFKFHPLLHQGIEAMGYTAPTPIQQQAIPHILEGRDLMGIAQTGTGKTAAFILPTLHRILSDGPQPRVRALVVVPTRELALQIDQAVEAYSYYTGISSIAVYGGTGGDEFNRERHAFTNHVEVVIATPGRLIAHMNLGYVDFSQLDVLILDEADRMLDMGFMPSLQQIVRAINPKRQTLLFSATMPQQILKLAHSLQRDPVSVSIAMAKPAEGVSQGAYMVHEEQKMKLIEHLLKQRPDDSILIFSSTKKTVSKLTARLHRMGLHCAEISSDLDQSQREKVMNDFRNRQLRILVATNVVSRGIDIDGIDLVVNYDLPPDAEDYVHRIGRTARAARKGEAITLVSQQEQHKLHQIEQLIGREVPKLAAPGWLGPVPEYRPQSRNRNTKGGHNRSRNTQGRGPKQGGRPSRHSPKPKNREQ